MDHTHTSHGIINAASQRFFLALGEQASQIAVRINTEPAFLNQLVIFAKSGCFDPSVSQQKAREIMGTNMFGVNDAIKQFGVNPSKAQLVMLNEVPFNEEVLASCKDTHVLVAFFPLSILDIRDRVKYEFHQLFHDESWYNREAYAKDKGEIGWHLIRKTPVPESLNKTWNEQYKLLGKDDETPKAVVMVYTIIGHYKATYECLFQKVWVRCSDHDSHGARVSIGFFCANVLDVCHYVWDAYIFGALGLASARK